jgi:hypothetical protein
VRGGLIEKWTGVTAGRGVLGDFGEVQVHRLDVTKGQGEPDVEYVGRAGELVARRLGARPAPRPAPRDLVLLANARFVGKSDFYLVRRDAFLASDLLRAGQKFFLKFSMALFLRVM